MAIQRYELDFRILSADEFEKWRDLPPAIVSDCMSRTQVMAGAPWYKPVAEGMKLLGQAGTVTCMAGGNSAAHVAIAMARPGEVLVIDAGGFEDTAIWGGIMTRAAVGRNLGDLVIGDDDGVCVVPLERADTILAASLEKFAQEEQTNADTTAGTLPVDQMGFGEPEVIGD